MELIQSLLLTVTVSFGHYDFCDFAYGVYRESNIRICLDMPLEDQKYALFHELGHHYFRRVLTPEKRAEFQKLHDAGTSFDDFTRRFAQESLEEDFCDTFANQFFMKEYFREEIYYRKSKLFYAKERWMRATLGLEDDRSTRKLH